MSLTVKKYKIKPYRSYYHYKKRKLALKRLGLMTCLMGLVVVSLIIGKDIQGFRGFDTGGFLFNVKPEVRETFYLEQKDTLYSVHNEPIKVKAVYLGAGYMDKLDSIVQIANETEVNAVVIDVKDDYGYLTFDSDNPNLKHMVKDKPPIQDIDQVMNTLYRNNIYPIARIVTFKDKVAGSVEPDRLVKRKDGTVFVTPKGEKWLDPYNKENWDYILEVCEEAIDVGFREIQFDYIRFHESMNTEDVDFPTDKTKIQAITEFVDYAYERLHKQGITVSADVFGTIITSRIDAEIVGQDYKELVQRLDYICPMVYPSHYGPGSFGVDYPDLDPYTIILESMQYSNSIIKEIPRAKRRAEVRPWLQDFTATWVRPHQVYGDEELRAQIQGAYDALIEEWIIWNAVGNYSEGGFEKE